MNRLSQFLILIAGGFTVALLIAVYLESQVAATATWYLFFALGITVPLWLVVFTARKARSRFFDGSRPESVRHEDRKVSVENSNPDALTTVRERYARGELTDEQFERKLDRLLATDTPEHAAEWRERTDETIREQSSE